MNVTSIVQNEVYAPERVESGGTGGRNFHTHSQRHVFALVSRVPRALLISIDGDRSTACE